jgi:hypothetical protein
MMIYIENNYLFFLIVLLFHFVVELMILEFLTVHMYLLLMVFEEVFYVEHNVMVMHYV